MYNNYMYIGYPVYTVAYYINFIHKLLNTFLFRKCMEYRLFIN